MREHRAGRRSAADDGASRIRPEQDAGDGPTVSAHETNGERVVFTESDNTDAWIATDLTVEPWR